MSRIAILVSMAMALWLFMPLSSWADDVQEKLVKNVDLDKPFEADLKDVLTFLSDRFDLKIEVDQEAFAIEKRKDPIFFRVASPPMPGVFLDTTLRFMLTQADAVYELRGKSIVVVPNRSKGLPVRFPDYTRAQKEEIRKRQKELEDRLLQLRVETGNIDASIKEALEFITDAHKVAILIDPKIKKIADSNVNLSKGTYTFDELMGQILKNTNATYKIRGDHILIVVESRS